MSKQDRQGVRTPAEVERKWNFGKSFAEAMGYATDAQKSAEAAQAAADRANEAYAGLNQEQIFNLLTDNGAAQGIYRGEDGQIYLNASYIMAGIIDAAVIQVVNLVAEKLKSVADFSELHIDGATIQLLCQHGETYGVQNYDDGIAYAYFTQFNEDGTQNGRSQFGANVMQIGGTWPDPIIGFFANDGTPRMKIGDSLPKTIAWKDNGDGTYTLIGM